MTLDSCNLRRDVTRRLSALAATAGLIAAAFAVMAAPSSADEIREVPAPVSDTAATTGSTEKAVLAGGCFWGVQGVYQHTTGVINAVSGYAGGTKSSAVYDQVGTGQTGHAEAVEVTFDPAKISYGKILQIFFSVVHDPTQLNRQGPDYGTQYRSAIFPVGPEQSRVAKAYIAQLDAASVFDAAIVTKIEPEKSFFPAENHHQDFLARNPTYPYIVTNDLPKIAGLRKLFPHNYREKPALVADGRPSH